MARSPAPAARIGDHVPPPRTGVVPPPQATASAPTPIEIGTISPVWRTTVPANTIDLNSLQKKSPLLLLNPIDGSEDKKKQEDALFRRRNYRRRTQQQIGRLEATSIKGRET